MARHGRQPNEIDGQATDVREPRTLIGTVVTEDSSRNTPTNNDMSDESDAQQPFYQANSNDPFQIAISQGVQDGNSLIDKRMKDMLRRTIIIVGAIAMVCVVVFGVMGARASQKMHALHEINACKDAVTSMNASYSSAFQLKGKVVDAFSSMDSSYDLEKLSTLYQEEVKAPKSIDCKVNPSETANKAKSEKATYDKQTKTFKEALKKIDTNQGAE